MKEKSKSEADRLFINLGYKKEKDNFLNFIEYVKELDKKKEYVISFEENNKSVCCAIFGYNYNSEPAAIDMQELNAIIKKCDELGWLNE